MRPVADRPSPSCLPGSGASISHSIVPVEFPPEAVSEHFQKFQLLFLREYVGALSNEDVYVPPSILRAYAPKGAEIDAIVAELTNLYEERLKKGSLEREKVERQVTGFLNRSNLWLSVLVLLFSISQATEAKWLNWTVAGLATVFVAWLFWRTYGLRDPDRGPERE